MHDANSSDKFLLFRHLKQSLHQDLNAIFYGFCGYPRGKNVNRALIKAFLIAFLSPVATALRIGSKQKAKPNTGRKFTVFHATKTTSRLVYFVETWIRLSF